MAKEKVVIVEDDVFVQKSFSFPLEKADFLVTLVNTGTDAIQTIRSIKPDLILLDVILPGKNGFEILKELKADKKLSPIPVIMITDLAQENDVQKGFKLGAIDYIPKATTPIHEIIKKAHIILK